ncbi:MAG: membrane protein insertion efficiency factor YidD [Candidatus Kerfeldbacteria bacterium]|nr:membrane protein insertion efficiency factor YidD [Candidatus Kerfeldbacteria bacterium]
MSLLTRALIAVIRAYQRTFSPDHGWGRAIHPQAGCRFYPSCSMYAIIALRRYGWWRGLRLAAGRLLRCNPWNLGGVDPVR